MVLRHPDRARGFAKEVNMTRRAGALLASAAILALVFGVTANAKPSKVTTQACTLLDDGDASGGGDVGIDVKSYGPLSMTVLGGGLEALFEGGGFSPNGAYSGPGRVLKRQGRLDFYFDLPASDCRPAGWDDEPGPGTGFCQYRLILLNGVYDRKADTVEFTDGTEALLVDSWGVVYGYDTLISEGTANLVVQFED
jgi:hypothetical protein